MASPYVTDASGTFIPATQRPDGSWRKARRIKEGYVPQEEVPLYESKGKQWAKGRSDYPVGLDLANLTVSAQPVKSSTTIPGLSLDDADSTKKGKKKKKKKPKSDSGVITKVEEVTENIQELSVNNRAKEECTNNAQSDPAKKLKSLRKKLREIEMLEKRIQSGELANPEKEQFEKISRKDEILEQIEDLEQELEDQA